MSKIHTPAFEPAHQAGLQNLLPGFFDIVTRCGMCIVTVKVQYALTKLNQNEITDILGKALQELNVGMHDSSLYPGCLDERFSGTAFHVFHVLSSEVEKAVARLQAELERLRLLSLCWIFQSETHDEFFVWWSPEPDLIGKQVKRAWGTHD